MRNYLDFHSNIPHYLPLRKITCILWRGEDFLNRKIHVCLTHKEGCVHFADDTFEMFFFFKPLPKKITEETVLWCRVSLVSVCLLGHERNNPFLEN